MIADGMVPETESRGRLVEVRPHDPWVSLEQILVQRIDDLKRRRTEAARKLTTRDPLP